MSEFEIEMELPPHCDKCGLDHFVFSMGDPCPRPIPGDKVTKPVHKKGDENCFWRADGG